MTPDLLLHAALHLHGLADAPYTLLRTLGDVVAHVETASGARVLRICQPGTTPERLAEVSAFQNAAADAGLPVAQRGTPRELDLPDGTRHWTLISDWIEGEAARPRTPQLVRELGALTAGLHALNLAPPTHWTGPIYDANWLWCWWHSEAPRWLTTEEVERCLPAVARTAAFLDAEADAERIIHSDLHFGNVLKTASGLAVLDFDDCAVAHPAFDLALTEGELLDEEDPTPLLAAYRAGYSATSGQPYPVQAVWLLNVLSATAFLKWLYGSPNPQVRVEKEVWVPSALERVAARA